MSEGGKGGGGMNEEIKRGSERVATARLGGEKGK